MSSEKSEATVLFTHYAQEVGQYLPRRKRKDIQMEILSLLEDALEDRSDAAGQAPDEEMAMAVLKSFGPPITFAENYHSNRALIGPAVFPFFQWVLYVVMAVFVLQFFLGLLLPGGTDKTDLLGTVDAFFDKGFQFFGVLVFSFALIERTTPEDWLRWPFREMARTWDPAGLKPERRKQAVHPRELWFEVVFLVAAIVLFAAFPQWVGVGNNRNGVWSFVPALSEAFVTYLPWLLGYLLLKLVFDVALVRQAFWDQRMRLVSIGIKVYGLVLILAFMTGPDVFGLNPAYVAMHQTPADMVSWFKSTMQDWNTGFRIYLFLMLFVQLIGLLRMVYKAFLGRETVSLRIN